MSTAAVEPEVPTEDPDLPPLAPVEKHSSYRNFVYKCTRCGREVGRDNLRAKRVQFREMGMHGRHERSRTTGWLCIIPADDGGPSCLELDPDWNREHKMAAPGNADLRDED